MDVKSRPKVPFSIYNESLKIVYVGETINIDGIRMLMRRFRLGKTKYMPFEDAFRQDEDSFITKVHAGDESVDMVMVRYMEDGYRVYSPLIVDSVKDEGDPDAVTYSGRHKSTAERMLAMLDVNTTFREHIEELLEKAENQS